MPTRVSESPPETPHHRLRHRTLLCLLGFPAAALCAALLVWFRLPPVAHDTLWAEDGRLFLFGAEQHGLFGATFLPYAGYLQFMPRLIAGAVVQWLPAADWALGMTAGACLVTGIIACVVFIASRDVLTSRTVRVILASVVVLIPLGPRDVLCTPTNLHSLLMWMLFWLLLFSPRTRRGAVAMSLLGAAAALSEIQAVFLLPLLIPAARRRHGWMLVTGPAIGITTQLAVTLLAPRSLPSAAQDSPLSIADGYLINTIVPDLMPQNLVGPFVAGGGLLLAVVILALLLGLVIIAWRHTGPRQRLAIVAAATLSVVIWTASVVDNPAPFYDYATMTHSQLVHVWLTRYGVVPGMLLLAVALIAADALLRPGQLPSTRKARPRRSGRHRLRFVTGVVTIGCIAACLTANYVPTWTRRSSGPSWSQQIPAAQDACSDAPDLKTITLKETIGWHVPVLCGYLRD
ncbi:hypothetical protein GCM10028798_22280 [Humibacter antri]